MILRAPICHPSYSWVQTSASAPQLQRSPEASHYRCHRAGVRTIEGIRYQGSVGSQSLALTFSWLITHSAIWMSKLEAAAMARSADAKLYKVLHLVANLTRSETAALLRTKNH